MWQTIDSAPQDGTEVLVCTVRPGRSSGPWTAAYGRDRWWGSWDDMRVIESQDDCSTDYCETPTEPTHWMPKPALPAAASTSNDDSWRHEVDRQGGSFSDSELLARYREEY